MISHDQICNMKKNIGSLDKTIRIVLAIILVGLYLGKIITGVYGTVSLVVAGILLLTSLINFCPLYKIFGWKTSE